MYKIVQMRVASCYKKEVLGFHGTDFSGLASFYIPSDFDLLNGYCAMIQQIF